MYNTLQMTLVRLHTSKEQVTPNHLIANNLEVLFCKVVKIYKNVTTSITVIRTCLLYEHELGMNATQAARNMGTVFGEDTVSGRTAQNWF
jgi:hypothetical protein